MSEHPSDNAPRGARPLDEWPTGQPPAVPGQQAARSTEGPPARIGRYPIERMLGEGGMGVVYAARDERLGRAVAVKTLAASADSAAARDRLWREARTAASVNHPNVCQIYEVGEEDQQVFIVMELLEGESLAERLARDALSVADALPVAVGMLSALTALHARGVVHRDLKPSNIFLTAHGVKLLDFGLATPGVSGTLLEAAGPTRSGTVVGTPRYMAPEQVSGEPVDARTDLFAAGAVLFEMLAGRPAFTGRTLADVLHATQHEQPPALTGSPAIAAIDRVVRRALAKQPGGRPASASEMSRELQAIAGGDTSGTPALAHALTRIVVLPFRVLRPDPDTDFLAFSLPDAISTSLSANPALVVRSSAVAARFAADSPDLKAVADAANVDRVVMGTLLRSGDRLRASAQLVDAEAGTLIASHTVESSMGELFGLQDDIARRVSDALALPLSGRTSPSTPDAPGDARAYEFYLRANELARTYDGLPAARDLYERALELDSRFAPAWARLGRCHRLIGKYLVSASDSEARAEQAFTRALAINPRLSIAHKHYANLEADVGQPERAVVRLLHEAARHGNDPELYAGLVHASRYCGLYEESEAAHVEARRLDPNVPTSIEQTLLMAGEIDRLVAVDAPRVLAGADDGIRVIGLGMAGHYDEARRRLLAMRQLPRIPAFQTWFECLMAWLERRPADMVAIMDSLGSLKIQEDPEALFQEGWLFCDAGEHERGFDYIRRAVTKGYSVASTLETARQFDALRGRAEFRALVEAARAGRARARAAFQDAGGVHLLGA